MAASNSRKKSTSSSSGRSSSGSRSSGTRRKSSGSSSSSSKRRSSSSASSRKAPPKKPVRREIGALVCLVLALFAAIGYFVSDEGAFIALFCNLVKGLVGYGFWIAPVMLLGAAVILSFHRGNPVRLRVTGTLLLPMIVGAFCHLLLAEPYEGNFGAVVAALWKDGIAQRSGGVLGGLLAIAVKFAFSLVGGSILLVILAVAAALCALHITPMDILSFFRETAENRPQYDPEDYPQRPARERRPVYDEAEEENGGGRVRRNKNGIDIPVDDGPVLKPKKPTEEIASVHKKKLFDQNPRAVNPVQLLTGKQKDHEYVPPEFEDSPPLDPIPDPPKNRRKAAPDNGGDQNQPGAGAAAAAAAAAMAAGGAGKEPQPDPAAGGQQRSPRPSEHQAAENPPRGNMVAFRRDPEHSQPQPESQQQPKPGAPEGDGDEDGYDEIPPAVIRQPAVQHSEKGGQVSAQDADNAQQMIAEQIAKDKDKALPQYRFPSLEMLSVGQQSSGEQPEVMANQHRLQDALNSFGVDAHIVNVICGPAVTRYELELEQGVKLNKITNLSEDIALALGASAVRVAPIPNKIATVGIEVPNRTVTPVAIREVLASEAFQNSKSNVAFAVGKDIAGNCIVGDIAKMPHLLIAGTTGSGKSVCTNSLIVSLLYKSSPEEVRLIMVDPKMVELAPYNGIPHLLIPVVTDPKQAAGALQWAVNEMMRRYRMFSEVGAKEIKSYNRHAKEEGKEHMAQIVVVIDELADLMVVAAKEVEESICRVAQMGRAAGMHLVVATQRPSSDVITGLMKANIPSRIAFAVKEAINSRIILDATGAEKLVGKGDMIYAPLGTDRLRVQGCFISEEEVQSVVEFIKQSSTANYDNEVMSQIQKAAEDKDKAAKGNGGADSASADDFDDLLPAAIDVVLELGQASVSMLQRRLKLGYGRAARMVDQMEQLGVVGPFEGSKPRQLLINKAQWAEMKYKRGWVDSVPDDFASFTPPPEEEFPDDEEEDSSSENPPDGDAPPEEE